MGRNAPRTRTNGEFQPRIAAAGDVEQPPLSGFAGRPVNGRVGSGHALHVIALGGLHRPSSRGTG
jgi:hypothetical protein